MKELPAISRTPEDYKRDAYYRQAAAHLEQMLACPDCTGTVTVHMHPLPDGEIGVHISHKHPDSCPNASGHLRWERREDNS